MISPGDTIRVAITGSAPLASVWQQVWHRFHAGSSDVTEQNLINALGIAITFADDEIDGLRHDGYSIDEITAWKWDTINDEWDGIGTDVLVGLSGESATDPLPHGAAAVGRYVTAALRRQGRHFIPGLHEGTAVDGQFTAGSLTTIADYLAEWAKSLTVTGESFFLCTYNTDPLSPLYKTRSTFAGTVIANGIIGYQRRRKPLVGL